VAVVYFEITTDGGVRNIRMVRSSGNIRFDFAVQGAVETAGGRGAFGPLPEGFAAPFLPIQLEVEPPR
jgi:TonB family protein